MKYPDDFFGQSTWVVRLGPSANDPHTNKNDETPYAGYASSVLGEAVKDLRARGVDRDTIFEALRAAMVVEAAQDVLDVTTLDKARDDMRSFRDRLNGAIAKLNVRSGMIDRFLDHLQPWEQVSEILHMTGKKPTKPKRSE